MHIYNFEIIRPPYETEQQESLDWCEAAHFKAESISGNGNLEQFRADLKERFEKVACKPGRIGKRGHFLADFLHRNWEEMEVYRLDALNCGAGLDVRSNLYAQWTESVFDEFYRDAASGPDHLIHVSCTGYVSPSGAQKIVSKKGWGESTTVTHAYHMGCYGAFPALRLARGFLADPEANQVDIVHTEICCLHINPSLHSADQIVSQSLFADGFIKYRANRDGIGLRVLAVKEEIIPNSAKSMTWDVKDWGFQMSLAKEIPVLIARSLKGYLERLSKAAGIDCEKLMQNAIFAIHPGGPKILSHVQDILGLTDRQLAASRSVLYAFGNMSSATIPHIWKEIAEDATIANGLNIVSLAFGPGLTISGSILVKECG